jgi:hypothetical protein
VTVASEPCPVCQHDEADCFCAPEPPTRTDRHCIPPPAPEPEDSQPVIIPDPITIRGVGMMRILVTSDEEKKRETVKPGALK